MQQNYPLRCLLVALIIGSNAFAFQGDYEKEKERKRKNEKTAQQAEVKNLHARPPACTSASLQLWLRADVGGLSWTDQSGAGVTLTDGTGATLNTANYINYNEAITFNDGITSVYTLNGVNFNSGANDRTIYVVVRPNSLDDSYVFGHGDTSGNSAFAFGSDIYESSSGILNEDGEATFSTSGYWENSRPSINTLAINAGAAEFYRDGVLFANDSVSAPYNTAASTTAKLGGWLSTSDGFWDGEIAEVLVYNRVITNVTERDRIDTYLALKYGIALSKDYLAYDASITAPIWDYGNSGGFDNNITGIGREDCQGLYQKQSISSSQDGIVAIGNTELAATNAANANAITDLSFMLWGNNAGNAAWNSSDNPAGYFVLDRKWKISETGSIGNLEIAIDMDNTFFDVPTSAQYFFVFDSDLDGSLTDETPTIMYDDGNNGDDNVAGDNIYSVAAIDLPDGAIFTIAIANLDTDGDGNADATDIDDDNDGILDTVESGGIDPLTDGDFDLVPIFTDDDDTNALIGNDNGIVEPAYDHDGDNIANHHDLDSDGDGIPDNVEGQTTSGFVTYNATDTDGDGLVDTYEPTGISPEDTLSDGSFDFLNTNSDGDGFNDSVEAGLALSGSDYDGDGLDNYVDDLPGYGDPDGNINDPTLLPDSDGDVGVGGGDVDYRDALPDFPDTDGDGINNDVDIDDDNDGIPDFADLIQIDIDGFCSFPDARFENPTLESGTFGEIGAVWRFSSVVTYIGLNLDAIVTLTDKSAEATLVDIDVTAFGFDDHWQPRVVGDANDLRFIEFEVTLVIGGTNTPFSVPRFGGVAIDLDGRPFEESVTIFSPDYFALNTPTDVQHVSLSGGRERFSSSGASYIASTRDARAVMFFGFINRAVFKVQCATSTSSIRIFSIDFGECNVQDLDDPVVSINNGHDNDTDGYPNHLDIDADGDGILDTMEVGHGYDTDFDGTVDNGTTAVGANGLLDALETFPDSGILNYTLRATPDGDTKLDYVDLDSDNDGIPDNIEAQPTNGYVAPTVAFVTSPLGFPFAVNVSNSRGINIAYGTGFTSVEDTDGDGIPDYRDTDSDDDGIPDIQENGMSNGIAGVDIDTDGIDFVFENGAGVPNSIADLDGYDPNDVINDPTNLSVLPDSDGDLGAGGDLDYRDQPFANPPTDAAIDFDGIDDHMTTASFMGNMSEVTIMAWVKLNTAYVNRGHIAGEEMFYLYTDAAGLPSLYVNTTGGTNTTITAASGAVIKNEWVHLTAVFSSADNEARIYVNGELEGSVTTSGVLDGSLSTPNPDFIIGRESGVDGNYYMGAIDEVRVFNTALSASQLQRLVYQEIENNAGEVRGTVIPKDVSQDGGTMVAWNELEMYLPMTDILTGRTTDYSGNGRSAYLKNITTFQSQTAPMPYETNADGPWTTQGTWLHGDVWDIENVASNKDWAIVDLGHDVTTINDHRLLGLIVQGSGSLTVNNDNSITNDWYLELDGRIDLEGEAQLIQTTNSTLEVTSAGTLERDQQGTRDQYAYNYFSSPVGASSVVSNNTPFIAAQLKDNAGVISFTTNIDPPALQTSPITLSNAWIYTFENSPAEDYNSWALQTDIGSIGAGLGFTMKGPGNGLITDLQNYRFEGKPNNGIIQHAIAGGNQTLVGNPYPSALDADQFIDDNAGVLNGGATTGTLYFWDQFMASNSHVTVEYVGGYAMYTKAGGVAAVAHPEVNATGSGTKVPTRYISVGQGFFVEADTDGGTIEFNNGQRVYRTEGAGDSEFFRNHEAQNTETEIPRIRIGFEDQEGYHRQLLLAYIDGASDEVDYGYDGKLVEDLDNDLFWMIQDERYIIQALGGFDASATLPLGYRAETDGEYTFMIDKAEGFNGKIYLRDNELKLTHDLTESKYLVKLPQGEDHKRFEIVFEAAPFQEVLAKDEFNLQQLAVYFDQRGDNLIIENPAGAEIKGVSIFNVLGQTVFEQNINEDNEQIIAPVTIGSGTYIVKLFTASGTVSKKVIN